ncbi:hypothetical protein IHE45_04G035800 [Dioscorea alata]|uniref:Uncharacterized protein n=2 Tax=Dioscorea alata TaxID=55571 RepID=A0ACB7WC45_DIOAL|nr:hypothetical protein IHE45_04G035800 [Dioscorea alata]KAH7685385.1 hypothetical protein IHE45_04G035800 [Dioscorea alata]
MCFWHVQQHIPLIEADHSFAHTVMLGKNLKDLILLHLQGQRGRMRHTRTPELGKHLSTSMAVNRKATLQVSPIIMYYI